jgi:hypothetical protein
MNLLRGGAVVKAVLLCDSPPVTTGDQVSLWAASMLLASISARWDDEGASARLDGDDATTSSAGAVKGSGNHGGRTRTAWECKEAPSG